MLAADSTLLGPSPRKNHAKKVSRPPRSGPSCDRACDSWPSCSRRRSFSYWTRTASNAPRTLAGNAVRSLAINHALMAAGLVDAIQVTIFPVISGSTGTEPIFGGAADFDLELLESRTFDGNIQQLTYRPTLHR